MIYLDHGATSFPKPKAVTDAVQRAMQTCANAGRGGYRQAMAASQTLFSCREKAEKLFDCPAEQVVFTQNCTHGLNIAIHSLVKPSGKVLITGFEHNAVTRPLYARKATVLVAGRKLFDWEDTLEQFEKGLKQGVSCAVFTHCSNVYGYILPVEQMAALCRQYEVPFIIDAAQSAGALPVKFRQLGADFIAMAGHKGLLGPMGTGILLCGREPEPLLQGGTGTHSKSRFMPKDLPEALETGTVNVAGIAGLEAGLALVTAQTPEKIGNREQKLVQLCADGLEKLGCRVFRGAHQLGTVSFTGKTDCEVLAQQLGEKGVCVRAGLHCAPLAHESGKTLDTGTVRVAVGYNTTPQQIRAFLNVLKKSHHEG